MQIKDPTSIKAMFQSMTVESLEVLRGQVISVSPLEIRVINDEKMILHENILCVPRHLTSYTAICDIAELGVAGTCITIHNSLSQSEIVYILSFNKGKKYYILDREV